MKSGLLICMLGVIQSCKISDAIQVDTSFASIEKKKSTGSGMRVLLLNTGGKMVMAHYMWSVCHFTIQGMHLVQGH